MIVVSFSIKADKLIRKEDILLTVYNVSYLFIHYNTITNYIRSIYELSNFNHLLSVVLNTRASRWNQNHDPHANSQTYYQLDSTRALYTVSSI